MYVFRSFGTALFVLVFLALSLPHSASGQTVPDSAPNPARGRVKLVLIGHDERPLPGVRVSSQGVEIVTNAAGEAPLELPAGVHTLRLQVDKPLVPDAPVVDGPWVIDLPDVPAAENQETSLVVKLSVAGAVLGFELRAPEGSAGDRSLEKEFAEKLEETPGGTVNGTVTAAEIGEPVSGARVYVRGAPVETVTDGDGKFSLELPKGKFQISIIHPEFSTESIPDVSAAKGKNLKVELHPASGDLDEMLVTGAHIEGGVASLIAERRETTAVADVIGAEQITRSGDTSAASALARVTGLTVVDGRWVIVRGMGERYSSMTVNGMQVPSPEPTRRVVPLDIFPTGVLESVVVQKTYSPDMPGEFGGGTVQVRTRGYPEEFVLNLTVNTAYNPQTNLRKGLVYSGGDYDLLGIDDGTRSLPDAFPKGEKLKPGNRVEPGYTGQELANFGKTLSNNYATKRERTPLDLGLAASVGDRYELRHAKIGFVAALGYKSDYTAWDNAIQRTFKYDGPNHVARDDFRYDQLQRQISLNGFFDWGVEFSPKQKFKFTTMVLRQTDEQTNYRWGKDDNLGRESRRTRLSWVERQVLMQQLSGKHVFEAWNDFGIDWRYSVARASRLEPDRREYQYIEDPNGGPYAMEAGSNGNERMFGELVDITHEGGLDLTIPVDIWSKLTAKFKVGGMAYSRERDAEVRRFQFAVPSSGFDLTAPPEELFAPANIGPGRGVDMFFQEVTLPNDFYDASMKLQAGYGMVELPITSSLDLMAGARVEHAVIEAATFDAFDLDAPPQNVGLDNTDVLPAATLTWRFWEDMQARAGYSRTLNRPDLRELSPSRYFDVEANVLYLGDVDLERALIDNYDVRLEYYLTADEVFSVGGFYKDFTNPIEVKDLAGSEDILGLENSDEAYLMGLEFEGRKRFDFVHQKLENLYFAGNFSLIKSEVEVVTDITKEIYRRPLQSQSPWVVNFQLGWDDTNDGGSGLAAAALFNMAGKRIRAIGDPDVTATPEPDQYEEPVGRLDLVLSQDLPHGFKLGAKAQNLLNPTQIWRQGDLVVRSFKRGVDVSASVSWSY